MDPATTLVKFSGAEHLRYRLVLSILSGRPVRIDGIRSDDRDPGLKGAKGLHPPGLSAQNLCL